ncbi:MAG: hypothetical protein CMH04_03580 [Marinovum sp.]|nr:hypothetical protein [Marinovum sp.]
MTYNLDDIDIRVFKLTSGEEVISLVSKDENGFLSLESPLQVHKRIGKDSHAFAFSDWQPLAKTRSPVILNELHIVSTAFAEDEIKERYIRMSLEIREQYDRNQLEDYEEELVTDDQVEDFVDQLVKKNWYH